MISMCVVSSDRDDDDDCDESNVQNTIKNHKNTLRPKGAAFEFTCLYDLDGCDCANLFARFFLVGMDHSFWAHSFIQNTKRAKRQTHNETQNTHTAR